MAYHQEDVRQFNNMLQQSNQNQIMSNATYSDYRAVPMREVYDASRIKDTNEYKTFINFLKYKEVLDMTEFMEKQGIITVNRPEIIEEEEEKGSIKEFAIGVGIVLAIIRLGILLA